MGSLREGECLRAHLRCERLLEKHSVLACGKTPSADGDSDAQQGLDRANVNGATLVETGYTHVHFKV